VEASARPTDGVVCFARLYRQVTESVSAELERTAFANPPFLERLDIMFANLFFAALEAHERDPARAPSAWAPLFSARSRRGIAPLQFALAGMNAHINGDLPVALVATCEEHGVELRAGSPEHADFGLVNTLLARVEAQVKASYLTGPVATIDRILHASTGSTTSSRCGTLVVRAKRRGPMQRRSGPFAARRACGPNSSAPSIGWSVSRAVAWSFLRTRCSGGWRACFVGESPSAAPDKFAGCRT
jgi:hypothetical protein